MRNPLVPSVRNAVNIEDLRQLARGRVPDNAKRHNFEVYADRRFFTITGHRLPDAPADVAERPEELLALHHRVKHGHSARHARPLRSDLRSVAVS